jgi:hypothetical protein
MTAHNSTPTVSPIAQIEALYDRLSKARVYLISGPGLWAQCKWSIFPP